MQCKDIIEQLNKLSPKEYACDWDNVGLLVGRENREVKKIMVALDATVDVVLQAVNEQVDMLITHHPMIFGSIKQVSDQSVLGNKILTLIENQISYYAMHTNFDIMGSMADIAAKRLSLIIDEPLEITCSENEKVEGIGRIGSLSESISVEQLVQQVKKAFDLPMVTVYGKLNTKVNRVAISPGSGKSMISEAINKKAQVLITGDIGHHEGIDASEAGLIIIDATHYGLEYIFMAFIQEFLNKNVMDIEVIMANQPDPCQFV